MGKLKRGLLPPLLRLLKNRKSKKKRKLLTLILMEKLRNLKRKRLKMRHPKLNQSQSLWSRQAYGCVLNADPRAALAVRKPTLSSTLGNQDQTFTALLSTLPPGSSGATSVSTRFLLTATRSSMKQWSTSRR